MGIKKRTTTATGNTSPCADLKAVYHECFNKWYSEKFLRGQWDKEECISEWEKYRACLVQHLDDKYLSHLLVDNTPEYSAKDNAEHPADTDGSSL